MFSMHVRIYHSLFGENTILHNSIITIPADRYNRQVREIFKWSRLSVDSAVKDARIFATRLISLINYYTRVSAQGTYLYCILYSNF